MNILQLARPKVPQIQIKPLQLRDVFRYLDWMTIGLNILVMLLPQPPDKPNAFLPSEVVYLCLSGLFMLSFIWPQHWQLWQRQLYILTSFSLILICPLAGQIFDLVLYILIAKACFLLGRRDLIIFLLCGGSIWTIVQSWYIYRVITFSELAAQNQQGIFIMALVGNTGSYIIASVFVLWMSLTILQERRSRSKAEQLAAEVEILAATVERSRIAREIHDSLGHRLTTLDVQLELAQRLQSRDPDRANQSISIAKQLAQQCLQDVRHAVHSMAAQSFDLNAAIQMLVQPIQNNPELKLAVRTEFPSLPATVSHQIYCIIQEGLTNIQRHSKATHIILQGYTIANQINVKLSDNGVGFNLDQASTGFGLRSMNERTQLIGGQLTLDSRPNEGTQIHLTIPILNSL
jgi:signal transduction histidine kinase